jgi:hypothetical protein
MNIYWRPIEEADISGNMLLKHVILNSVKTVKFMLVQI